MQKYLSALLFLLPVVGFTQVMQDQKATVKYVQLPQVKINDGSKMYSVVNETPFLQKNQDSLAMYELNKQNYFKEVEAALESWRMQNSGGDRGYWAQMANYETQINAGVVGVNPPVLTPAASFVFSKPYPKKPFLLKEITSSSVVAGIKIDGFNQSQDAPVKITLTWNGFERGTTTETKTGIGAAIRYKFNIQYKHRINIKVDVPGKGLVLNEVIAETDGFRVYTTSEFKTKADFKLWWIDNEASFWEQRQNELVMQHVATINNYLNDKVGYPKKQYGLEIHTVKKGKDFDYTDLLNAWTAAQDGFLKVEYPEKDAEVKQKLQQAIDIWAKALLESNVNERKTRIDKEVTAAIYVNMAQAYLWIGDYTSAELSCNKALGVDFGRYNREARPTIEFIRYMKLRAEANR